MPEELRLEIGKVCLLLKIEHPEIKKKIEFYYKNYLSRGKADIYVNIRYKDSLIKPDFESLISETEFWTLGRTNGGCLSLYFPGVKNDSVAVFDGHLNKVEIYTQDPSGQIFFYLFPIILFSLLFFETKALVFHACGILSKKKGYLLLAQSGGGKSTIAKLALIQGMEILNDDRIIVRKEKGVFNIYGTPWHGENEENLNRSVPIREAFFLKKSWRNEIKQMSKAEAVAQLFKSSFCIPINKDIIKARFDFCLDLSNNLNSYWLSFKPDKSIWEVLDGLAKQSSKEERKYCLENH